MSKLNEWDIIPRELYSMDEKITELTEIVKQSIAQQLNYKKANENFKKQIVEMQKEHQKHINNILKNNELLIKSQFLHYKNKLKPILKNIQSTNDSIKTNLNSGLYKQRSDNLLWRSYSNNFLGLNSLVNPLIVSATVIDENENVEETDETDDETSSNDYYDI